MKWTYTIVIRYSLFLVQGAANTAVLYMSLGKLLSALFAPFFWRTVDTPFEGNSEVKSLDKGQSLRGYPLWLHIKGILTFSPYVETAHICNCVLMNRSVFLFCVCVCVLGLSMGTAAVSVGADRLGRWSLVCAWERAIAGCGSSPEGWGEDWHSLRCWRPVAPLKSSPLCFHAQINF